MEYVLYYSDFIGRHQAGVNFVDTQALRHSFPYFSAVPCQHDCLYTFTFKRRNCFVCVFFYLIGQQNTTGILSVYCHVDLCSSAVFL